MSVLLPLGITAATAIAALAALLTAVCSGFYTARPPQGSDAMGLIVPFALAAASALALTIGGALAGGHGSLDWLVGSRGLGAFLLGLCAALVGGAVLGALIGWCEKHPWANAATLNVAGVLLPALFMLFLVVTAWTEPEKLRSDGFRTFGLVAGAAPAVGLVVAILGLQRYVHVSLEREAWRSEALAKEAAERGRREAMTPESRLLEDLSKFAPDAPLWTLVAGLPDEANASLRAIWIERALQHPNFESELQGTLTCDYAVYRHGCVMLLLEMPAERLKPDVYADWLASDATQTAADIRTYGLVTRKYDDYRRHAANTERAAARLTLTEPLRAALAELRDAVAHPGSATE
ncbi:MAG: hypothetical protein JNM94_06695 [Phycisphaerae bacterium]|nr:hypothetical protein [Phycisphaerae bacterium]